MTFEAMKALALEALMAGPWQPGPGDPLASIAYLLKRDGVPVVSRNVGKGGRLSMVHELIDTGLDAEEIRASRQAGLAEAMRLQRWRPVSDWKESLDTIHCPFARDEAAEYLRGIVYRMRFAGAH